MNAKTALVRRQKNSGKLPLVSRIRAEETSRLIPSKYSIGEDSVLTRIANDNTLLADAFDLDSATNDRLLAENQLLPGIGTHELVFGIPYASIINAAFAHPTRWGIASTDPIAEHGMPQGMFQPRRPRLRFISLCNWRRSIDTTMK